MEYTYIGKDVPQNNATDKVSGWLRYAADIHLPRMAYMKLFLSPVSHGFVKNLDVSQAEKLPGVLAVLSYENTSDFKYNRMRTRANKPAVDQETLFSQHVRFVGDRIAAVVAETPEIALKAVSLIRADIESLPAVFDPKQARAGALPPMHENDSIVERPPSVCGGDYYTSAQGEEFCHHSASQRVSHVAMESHCAVADYDPYSDSMTVYTGTQSVYGVRSVIATIFDMPMSRVRVLKTPMGGSFGSKHEMILEPLAACAARAVGRPVMLKFNREEVMLCTILKPPVESNIRVKFDSERKITGISIDCLLDSGAYQGSTPAYADAMYKRFSWVYDIPNIEYRAAAVCTNTPVSGSFRGWGSPETAFIMENMMNAAARHFGIDPIELRLRNVLEPYAISRIDNYPLGNLPLKEALTAGRERFRWEERKERLAAQDPHARYLRGIGMAMSTHTSGYYPRKGDWATVVLKMEEDGSVHVNCNVHDHGCGEASTFRCIVAEVLLIPPETVDVREADTAYNAFDNGCYSSRTTYVMGRSVMNAARELLAQLRRNAAEMLQCAPEDLSQQAGGFFVAAEPERNCTYSDVAYYVADKAVETLLVAHTYVPNSNPAPGAAHFAEVEVDTYTGMCRVTDYLAVQDVGKALSPAMCQGQIGSALQQGMGFVFCEELKIDPKTGRALNADLQRYHVARACDFPNLDILFIEHPDDQGPFGAKSIGEACFVPVAPTLVAAVNDALKTDLTTLPLEPARILDAINRQRKQ